MPEEQKFVVIGAGEAGGMAVQTLREEGFDGSITLIGAEAHLPYERPSLSKSVLRGEEYTSEGTLKDQAWYDDQGIDVRLSTRAESVDRAGHRVTLAGGGDVPYNKLLIATGAQPRQLRAPGADLPGVFTLRTLEDAQALATALHDSQEVVIIGAGWIGLEVASGARAQGCHVTIAEPRPVPLEPAMGAKMGGFFADFHREHGVDLILGHGATALRGNGHVEAVVLDDGRELPAQTVVIGVGVAPDTALFTDDQLVPDHGVPTDPAMRTSDPDVFVAGDIASVDNPLFGHRIRVEHWANALMQGRIAAHSMLGKTAEFDPSPFFFTDQYDLSMEYTGWVDARKVAAPVIRGDLAARVFHAFWVVDGVVVAGMHANSWDDGIAPVQELVRRKIPVDVAKLADPAVPFADIVGTH